MAAPTCRRLRRGKRRTAHRGCEDQHREVGGQRSPAARCPPAAGPASQRDRRAGGPAGGLAAGAGHQRRAAVEAPDLAGARRAVKQEGEVGARSPAAFCLPPTESGGGQNVHWIHFFSQAPLEHCGAPCISESEGAALNISTAVASIVHYCSVMWMRR
ncbi:uncharacterized protein LOC144588982 isoform X2 [Pogona vitticeps]